jgi:hypothetical protein
LAGNQDNVCLAENQDNVSRVEQDNVSEWSDEQSQVGWESGYVRVEQDNVSVER